jgi:hypothetical protein
MWEAVEVAVSLKHDIMTSFDSTSDPEAQNSEPCRVGLAV